MIAWKTEKAPEQSLDSPPGFWGVRESVVEFRKKKAHECGWTLLKIHDLDTLWLFGQAGKEGCALLDLDDEDGKPDLVTMIYCTGELEDVRVGFEEAKPVATLPCRGYASMPEDVGWVLPVMDFIETCRQLMP